MDDDGKRPWETWKPTKKQLETLKEQGVYQIWGDLDQNEYGLKRLSQITDMSAAWLRTQLKDGTIPSKRDKRNRYVVTKDVVMQIRYKFAQKHLNIAQRRLDGKKYHNKPPRQWAYDMTTSKIRDDGELTPHQKKIMLKAMNRYKAQWESAAKARKAKIEANKAKK